MSEHFSFQYPKWVPIFYKTDPFQNNPKWKPAIIRLSENVAVHTSNEVDMNYQTWIKTHEYGPYILHLSPTGLYTSINLTHEKSGDSIDLTDYEVI